MATKFNALFYPKIEPPLDLFKSYLLYFDTIISIVPKDEKFNPSFEISEIIDKIPGCVDVEHPEPKDLDVPPQKIETLKQIFSKISSKTISTSRKIIINKNTGELNYDKYYTIRNSKLTNDVYTLLNKYLLIDKTLTKLEQDRTSESVFVIDEEAGNLILSYIADSIGRRKGLNTITNSKSEFVFSNKLDNEFIPNNNAESYLVQTMLNAIVPKEINHISLDKLKKYREQFEDVRYTFHTVMPALTKIHKLEYMNKDELIEKIDEVTKDFKIAINKVVKSKKSNSSLYKKIYYGVMETLKVIPFMETKIIGATGNVTMKIFEKEPNMIYNPEKQLIKAIGSLNRDIITDSKKQNKLIY